MVRVFDIRYPVVYRLLAFVVRGWVSMVCGAKSCGGGGGTGDDGLDVADPAAVVLDRWGGGAIVDLLLFCSRGLYHFQSASQLLYIYV